MTEEPDDHGGIERQLAGFEQRFTAVEHQLAVITGQLAGLDHRCTALEIRLDRLDHRLRLLLAGAALQITLNLVGFGWLLLKLP